jgi:dTMP kinase
MPDSDSGFQTPDFSMRGLFITLEGIDGCGKSTQLDMLAGALDDRRIDFTVTRQPGGTQIGERVREILLANASVGLAPMAELMLYAADRAQNVEEIIRPALDAGRLVVSDRYTDSTIAFQGYGRGLDLEVISELNHLATSGLAPDLTVLFDISTEEARARLLARQTTVESEQGMTRFEDEAREFHHRVRQGYLELARAHAGRIRVVDSSGSAQETHEKVMALIAPLIASRHA